MKPPSQVTPTPVRLQRHRTSPGCQSPNTTGPELSVPHQSARTSATILGVWTLRLPDQTRPLPFSSQWPASQPFPGVTNCRRAQAGTITLVWFSLQNQKGSWSSSPVFQYLSENIQDCHLLYIFFIYAVLR